MNFIALFLVDIKTFRRITMNVRLDYALRVVIGILVCFPLFLLAEHIVIESERGTTYILDVNQEDSFLEVVKAINAFNEKDLMESEYLAEELEEALSFKVFGIAKNILPEQLIKKVRSIPRSYEAGITAAESADIIYILKTLANSSLPKIKSAEASLKKAGERIDHLHPFYFLSCIFTNEELKVCVRNLQGRAWVWKNFLTGTLDSLSEESARNNLLPYVHDFASKVKVDVNIILPIIQAERWERLVNTLIDEVPREGEPNRYNI